MSQVRNLKGLLSSGFGSKAPFSVLRRFSSMGRRGPKKADDFSPEKSPELNVPSPIPGRPLRSQRPVRNDRPFPPQNQRLQQKNQPRSRGDDGMSPHRHRSGKDRVSEKSGKMRDFDLGAGKMRDFDLGAGNEEKEKTISESSVSEFLVKERKRGDSADNSFLEKFKLGSDKEKEKTEKNGSVELLEENGLGDTVEQQPREADLIFKKMKETGLIPNAVAMLDGLCKDGLIQEAMKLFGLMREKGTIPEVVIYTAVVEGYCKADKADDAKKVFKKMQANGIVPNAFSYSVLVQGLCKCDRLEDGIGFCEEMLESGHSPNVTTFVGLVDGVCREKGVEEARVLIGTLRQKGFFLDEKAVKEYLDRRGLFNSKVWEAIIQATQPQKDHSERI